MLNCRNKGCGIQLMESLEDRSTLLVRTLMAVWIPSEEHR